MHPKPSPHAKIHKMAPTPLQNFLALLVGKFGKSGKSSTVRHQRANQANPYVKASTVRALGALRSLRFTEHHTAGLKSNIQFFDREERRFGWEEFVEKEMAAAR
jgi:hypothetical protein